MIQIHTILPKPAMQLEVGKLLSLQVMSWGAFHSIGCTYEKLMMTSGGSSVNWLVRLDPYCIHFSRLTGSGVQFPAVQPMWPPCLCWRRGKQLMTYALMWSLDLPECRCVGF